MLDDAIDGDDAHAPVLETHLLGLVGTEVRSEQELGEGVNAHDMPLVGRGRVPCPPAGGAKPERQCDDQYAVGDPPPGADAPGRDPDPAPGVATDAGHAPVSGGRPARVGCPPTGGIASGELVEPCQPASSCLLGRHGPDRLSRRREGGTAADAQVTAFGRVRHPHHQTKQLRPLLGRLRRQSRSLPNSPVDALALRPAPCRAPGGSSVPTVLVSEPRGASAAQEHVQRHGAPILVRDALQRVDLLGGGERVLGEGEEATGASAPADRCWPARGRPLRSPHLRLPTVPDRRARKAAGRRA